MSALPSSAEVLVIGAGPAGLALAASLVDKGVDVVVIDKQAEAANTSRAAVVHARTLEVLRELDITDELIARGIKVETFTVRERDRVLLHVGFDDLPTPYPYTLMCPQNVTEEILLKHLRDAGGQVHRPLELSTLEQDAEGVTATLASGETIRARYAVGADGMHSVVRDQTGIGFTGDTYAQSFLLADVHLDWAEGPDQVRLFFSPEGVTVLAPLPGDHYRIVATMDEAPEHPDVADCQALMDSRGPRTNPITIADVVWSSRFRVHHRLADHYREDRVFLAGDAAHVHSPAGGQGMNTGVQDALHLASRLASVIREGAAETTLDEYETERRPIAEGVVSFTDKMTRVATLGHASLRGLRNTALRALDFIPAVHHKMAMNLSELGTDPQRK
ncbi:MAG TPA: FAD-dependent oxidoreductase [Stackebrandtia sp.]|uniref:FAD-dependent oxidoreductase n=1 Tax=Stackebrandtia sp. TaxID=2023065 RepID=UPI002D42D646|nr:FAD-dependent oxidoreductase [Stackebrandtia sp.]HZE40350.1 FAD-dependent oxidoreductase [Stackebrandtia sp.]